MTDITDKLRAIYPELHSLNQWDVRYDAADEIHKLRARIAALEAALREAYEVYAGSDGFIPETAAEGYQQQIIKQMVDIIGAAMENE